MDFVCAHASRGVRVVCVKTKNTIDECTDTPTQLAISIQRFSSDYLYSTHMQMLQLDKMMWTTFLLICLYVSCASALKPLSPFSFASKGQRVDVPGDTNKECDVSKFKEDAPGIVLAMGKQGGHDKGKCWDGGTYNNRDISIQPGLIGSLRAYQISAPKTKATEFVASKTTIWLSFKAAGSYKIYFMNELGELQEQGTVTFSKGFVKIPVIADAAKIFAVSPASTRVSVWPQLAAGVEGAILHQDSSFKITARRWDVSVGQPVDPATDYQSAPANQGYTFGFLKYFFPVSNKGKEGFVWQDPTTLKVFLSWLSADLLKISNIELPTNGMYVPVLYAAAGNGEGEVRGQTRMPPCPPIPAHLVFQYYIYYSRPSSVLCVVGTFAVVTVFCRIAISTATSLQCI